MSASLLRRGLELLSHDIKDVNKGKKKKRKQQPTPSSATVMDLVSTKRQGVTKQVKLLQGRQGHGKSKATVKNKRIKSAVEEFRKKQGKSHMQANLKYFLGTISKTTDSDTLKILNHNTGRQSRDHPERPAKEPKPVESVFTEKEFQQFQKEYFGTTVKQKK
ncbi:ribosomal protein S19 binding protein 1 [Platichthys flesus]|uniref:ribosomal protein S19 binding protein 1 n=1 Tax=Platichthys flesus TaxID=8260 RepID=UPI002DBF1674|nr:ribosomal protein S19 binding protein 1 [Platichthys flesus]